MAGVNALAIEIQGLDFFYQGQRSPLFSNFNLEIARGERFGLFGPNGAGKTTLMNLMTGLLNFNSGSIKLLGQEIKNGDRQIKSNFGFVPQELSFYQELSPAENLEFFGAWAGLNKQEIKARTAELLEILGLQDVKDRRVQTFSGGMKRRVNLAIGVIHRPPILFLDEPTVGVDVQSRFAIINYLRDLNKNGTTLIYTSHQLDEAEELCSHIALIDEGKIVVNDLMDNLLAKHHQQGLEGLFLGLTGKKYRDS